MRIFNKLKEVTSVLSQFPRTWGICGGVAASIYRDTPRFTGDIDIALIGNEELSAVEIAEYVAKKVGYQPIAGWVTDQNGQLIKQQSLVVGREDNAGHFIGIDFILPVMPWVEEAVIRANDNLIDYGFAKIPTLTAEDLLIAKMYSFQGTPERHQDLDDIKAILRNTKEIDLTYIKNQMKKFDINNSEIL